jgi:hypothetical protein
MSLSEIVKEKGGGTYETSERPPRYQQMYAGFGVLQIEVEVFSESFDSCFTGIVGWVAGRIGNALLAPCDDNGGRVC